MAVPWENSHLPVGDHFLLRAPNTLFLVILQVIEVRFALGNGHRDPHIRIGDEVTLVLPGASGNRWLCRACHGRVGSNVVLSFGAGEWDFHYQLGLHLGPGEQAGTVEVAAQGPHGAMGKRLDPSQGDLQIVHLPVVLWDCEVVGTERVQQQGDEQIEHLKR